MKIFIIALLTIVSAQFVHAGNLELSVFPKTSVILPLQDVEKCSSKELLNGPVFEVSKLLMKWGGNGTFTPVQITIQINDQNIVGGQYSCNISGNELNAIFSSRSISQGDFQINTCELKCGSINTLNNSFTAQANLTVFGIQNDSQNNSTPVKETINFNVVNKVF